MKKYLFKISLFFILLFVIWICIISIDYYRASRRQEPFFTFRTEFVLDGGTKIFSGLGYTITFYNQIMTPDGRTDTTFRFIKWEKTFNTIE